jgi:16S rRNA (cytosine967-C5)-methyltransferase
LDNPSVRKIAVEILTRVRSQSAYADELIDSAFKHHRFELKDKALLVELANGSLRWRGLLDWLLAKFFRGDFERCPAKLKSILEVSLYQLKFLDKIPSYAAVSEGVELAKQEGGPPWAKLVNGVLRNYLREANVIKLPATEDNLNFALSICYSHPEWLIERWLKRYGLGNTIAFCEYNNQRPAISVRVNTAKISRAVLMNEFEKLDIGVEPSKYFEDFIKITRPHDITQIGIFTEGYFAIQDESTAIACSLLSPEKGDTVLDMCAAPGGKSCYLAALTGETGKVIAVDKNSKRVERIKENARRLNLRNVQPVAADSTALTIPPVDKILLDAPCSGLGVLSKRADLRWKQTPEDISSIHRLQTALLENASKLLKNRGELVYSTCTLEPEENEEMVAEFLSRHKNFEIVSQSTLLPKTFATPDRYWRSLPFQHGMDGSFAVKFIKKY